jgi:hypothetical protein
MAKTTKSAAELADIIRSQLAEQKTRVAVFPGAHGGWNATVYFENGSVRDLQRRVDEIARGLNGLYELGT